MKRRSKWPPFAVILYWLIVAICFLGFNAGCIFQDVDDDRLVPVGCALLGAGLLMYALNCVTKHYSRELEDETRYHAK